MRATPRKRLEPPGLIKEPRTALTQKSVGTALPCVAKPNPRRQTRAARVTRPPQSNRALLLKRRSKHPPFSYLRDGLWIPPIRQGRLMARKRVSERRLA